MVGTIFYFILAGICLVISIFQFMEKGVCLNNAYLYASKEEREKMDKSPYYRQSAIVLLLLFLSFGAYGIYAITYTQWLLASGVIAIVVAVIYAIASSIRVNRK